MNMEHLGPDDNELQEEFGDLSSRWKESVAPVKKLPGSVNRRIRDQARYQLGNELKDNWVFGNLPLVWLAACIFFAMSLYFVMSMEFMQKNSMDENSTIGTETARENLLVTGSPNLKGWVKFSFRVDGFGYPKDIEIIGRCLTLTALSECDPSKEEYFDAGWRRDIDTIAINNLKSHKFDQIPGRIQKLVYIKGTE